MASRLRMLLCRRGGETVSRFAQAPCSDRATRQSGGAFTPHRRQASYVSLPPPRVLHQANRTVYVLVPLCMFLIAFAELMGRCQTCGSVLMKHSSPLLSDRALRFTGARRYSSAPPA